MITLEKKTSDDYKLHSIIYFFRLRAYYEVNGYQVGGHRCRADDKFELVSKKGPRKGTFRPFLDMAETCIVVNWAWDFRDFLKNRNPRYHGSFQMGMGDLY